MKLKLWWENLNNQIEKDPTILDLEVVVDNDEDCECNVDSTTKVDYFAEIGLFNNGSFRPIRFSAGDSNATSDSICLNAGVITKN